METPADGSLRPDQGRGWLTRIFDRTTEVAGATLGAAMGAGMGLDPVATAAVGASLAQSLKTVGEEIQERLLGPRERERLSKGAVLIVHKIKQHYREGKLPRSDSFFQITTQTGHQPRRYLRERY